MRVPACGVCFSGERKADDIVNWLKKKTGPAAEQVKTQEELDKLKEEDVVVIGFFKVPFLINHDYSYIIKITPTLSSSFLLYVIIFFLPM